MKDLKEYINEAMNAEELFMSAVLNAKLNKEQIKDMLSGLGKNGLVKLSKYLSNKYPKEYVVYEPNPDMFLKDLDKVIDNISSFILKMDEK